MGDGSGSGKGGGFGGGIGDGGGGGSKGGGGGGSDSHDVSGSFGGGGAGKGGDQTQADRGTEGDISGTAGGGDPNVATSSDTSATQGLGGAGTQADVGTEGDISGTAGGGDPNVSTSSDTSGGPAGGVGGTGDPSGAGGGLGLQDVGAFREAVDQSMAGAEIVAGSRDTTGADVAFSAAAQGAPALAAAAGGGGALNPLSDTPDVLSQRTSDQVLASTSDPSLADPTVAIGAVTTYAGAGGTSPNVAPTDTGQQGGAPPDQQQDRPGGTGLLDYLSSDQYKQDFAAGNIGLNAPVGTSDPNADFATRFGSSAANPLAGPTDTQSTQAGDSPIEKPAYTENAGTPEGTVNPISTLDYLNSINTSPGYLPVVAGTPGANYTPNPGGNFSLDNPNNPLSQPTTFADRFSPAANLPAMRDLSSVGLQAAPDPNAGMFGAQASESIPGVAPLGVEQADPETVQTGQSASGQFDPSIDPGMTRSPSSLPGFFGEDLQNISAIQQDDVAQAQKVADATWFSTVRGGQTLTDPDTGLPRLWNDPQGVREGPQASGIDPNIPGLATPGRANLGQMMQITGPSGESVWLPKVDIGPGTGPASVGRTMDFNAPAANALGLAPNTGVFSGWDVVGPGSAPMPAADPRGTPAAQIAAAGGPDYAPSAPGIETSSDTSATQAPDASTDTAATDQPSENTLTLADRIAGHANPWALDRIVSIGDKALADQQGTGLLGYLGSQQFKEDFAGGSIGLEGQPSAPAPAVVTDSPAGDVVQPTDTVQPNLDLGASSPAGDVGQTGDQATQDAADLALARLQKENDPYKGFDPTLDYEFLKQLTDPRFNLPDQSERQNVAKQNEIDRAVGDPFNLGIHTYPEHATSDTPAPAQPFTIRGQGAQFGTLSPSTVPTEPDFTPEPPAPAEPAVPDVAAPAGPSPGGTVAGGAPSGAVSFNEITPRGQFERGPPPNIPPQVTQALMQRISQSSPAAAQAIANLSPSQQQQVASLQVGLYNQWAQLLLSQGITNPTQSPQWAQVQALVNQQVNQQLGLPTRQAA